jgi:iron complex outermembrane receptor protein
MFRFTPVHVCVLAALGALSLGAAQAQQGATSSAPQRVEITGTNIKRIDAETSSPVQIISAEDIRRSGAASVKELLDQLPAASGTLSDISGSNSFASGASAANLRNLGKTSTLILFNGRRVSPYALADFNDVFTNVDALPLEAVERVEILRNGASAVYGSDAVAGVINIITRRDYRGVQVRAGYERSTTSNAYGQGVAGLTAGFGDLDRDGFNVLGSLEVFKRDSVIARDVIEHLNPLRFRAGVIPPTFVGQTSTFSYPGNLVPGGPITGCAPELVIGGLCRYDRFERFQLVPAAERAAGLVSATFKLGSMQGFAEGLFSRTKTTYVSPFQPYGPAVGTTTWGNPQTNTGQTFVPRGLPAGHPLNFTGEDDGDFRYRFIDAPSGSSATADNYRVLAGLRGTLANGYEWETSLGFLGSKVEDRQQGNFSNSGFIELIGDYNQATLSADFFNKPGGYRIGQPNSAAIVNRLFPIFGNQGKTTQTVLDGKLTGEWGSMAGGPIGVAVGAELRRERFTIDPSDNLRTGDIVGLGLSATDGRRTFGAAFAELNLPVSKALEFQVAARVDKYPRLSANLTPKVGGKWRVNENFMVRGTAETGFRAPNLTETAPSVKFAFNTGILDPKRCEQAAALSTDLRNVADPLPDSDPNKGVLLARADIVEQNECTAGVAAIVGNNPELKPERTKSFTLGFVFEPVRNLAFTVDYWNIRRKDEINNKTAEELLNIEDVGLPPGSSIVRKPLDANDQTFTSAEQAQYGVTVGSIDSITRSFENLFQTRTSGIDVGVNLREDTRWGRLTLDAQGSYIISYRAFNGTDLRFGNNLAGDYAVPRWTMRLSAALKTGAWTNGFNVFHTSATTLQGDYFDPTGTPTWCAARGLQNYCLIRASTTVDYFLRYEGIKGLSLGLYAKNLAGKFAPVDFRDQWGTPIPQQSDDAKRRSVRLSAEYKF